VLTFHITIFVTPKLKQELHDFNPFHTIPLKEMLTIFKQHPFHSSGRLSLAWLLNMCFNWLVLPTHVDLAVEKTSKLKCLLDSADLDDGCVH
jgi:hypothetical protein